MSIGKGGRVLLDPVLAVPLSGSGGIFEVVVVEDPSFGKGGNVVCVVVP